MTRVTVVAGGSPIGAEVARQLVRHGCDVVATFRRESAAVAQLANQGVDVVRADLDSGADLENAFAGADVAVLTPILTKSVQAIASLRAAGVVRSVFFSSNNVAADADAPVYRALAGAEKEASRAMPNAIIVRPTLIYGHPELKAVVDLCRLMRRSPFVPVPGAAWQQPIFYRDIANLAVGLALGSAPTGIYASGGPEIMTTRQFYTCVSRALGGTRILVQTPGWAIAAGARIAKGLGFEFPLDAAQIARVDLDRRAVEQMPLPEHLKPKTTMEIGLAHLIAQLDEELAT
jgi:NADH dehydrogenase